MPTDPRTNQGFVSEIKFLISPECAQQICGWASSRLDRDPNGSGESGDRYQITSLYFDTQDFAVFHRKGSYGRSKYRLRKYDPEGAVFLERKLKVQSRLKKRRTLVASPELSRLAIIQPEAGWAGYWFHRRLQARSLHPICQISYDRMARVAATNQGPIRLTLDRNIFARANGGLVFLPRAQRGVELLEKRVVLELKYAAEIPVLFKQLVQEFALNPQSVSKYRLAAVSLGLTKETNAPFSVKV